MNLAIIPARGGSKRIPGKNVRDFCGRPVIAWSIAAARRSGLFDLVVVSTDCPEIASVANEFGAETPFRRPPELADDHAPTIPVVRHAIEQMQQRQGLNPQRVCCIYATAPLLEPADLQTAEQCLLQDPELEFAVSVTRFSFPVLRAVRIDDRQRISMFWPEHELTRSQDLPAAWHDAGQFYFGRTAAFFDNDGVFNARTAPVCLPASRVQDIDTEEDWARAEAIFRLREAVV